MTLERTVRVNVRREDAAKVVRASTRELSAALGLEPSTQAALCAALLELIHRSWSRGSDGELRFDVQPDALRVSLRCNGQFEPEALSRTLAQVASLVDAAEDAPPEVVLKVKRAAASERLWPAAFPASFHDEALQVAEVNTELVTAFGWIQQLARSEARLRAELDECRRGVGHLYSELDEKAEALRRLSDGRGRFLSSMTHEFRTPLASILTLSRMLLDQVDGPLSDEQGRQVGFVRKSAETLSDLMNDLIDLSRLDAGRAPVNARPFRVADLFGNLMGLLRPLLRSESVSLVFEEPVGVGEFLTDELKLSQVLRNLLANALKYTERGEVRVRAVGDEHGFVTFSVKDTGVGIAPADHERIFDEFVQVEGGHQKKVKGSGLGLSISHRIVGLLGGRIWVESALGQGATFFVRVPMEFRSDAPLVQAEAAKGAVVIAARSREAVARYERLVKKCGLVAVPAQDAPYARLLVGRDSPRALIVDLDISDTSLWSLVDEVSAAAELPVLVVSSESAASRAAAARVSFFTRRSSDDELRRALSKLPGAVELPRVLLVDDDESHRYLMRRLLMMLHVQVIEAGHGTTALELARELRPSAVVLDLGLPDVDGMEVLERLKADERTRDIPVLVNTGRMLTEAEQRRIGLAQGVIQKVSRTQEAQLAFFQEALAAVGVTFARERVA